MTTHVKVYPTKESALKAHHPTAGAPKVEGADWPDDVFTCRRLTDGSFTTDPAKAFKPEPMKKAGADTAAGSSDVAALTPSADAKAEAGKSK